MSPQDNLHTRRDCRRHRRHRDLHAVSRDTGFARSGAVVEMRQKAMKGLGEHVKAIKAFVENGDGEAADVARRATEIAATATKIPDLFPEGTGMEDNAGKTGAKPAIWSEHEAFIVAANQLQERAQALAAAAAAGDADMIAQRFAEMGKEGCGSCHDKFRKKLD